MSSVAGQSVAIGNLGKVGGKNMQTTMLNQDKMQMFVERYLELSNELKYRKGESGAYLQLGELMTQKGDFDTSTKHFYRAMKIAEETGDGDMKEQAKVNFGMANASMKWTNHVSNILTNLQGESGTGADGMIEEDEDEGEGVFGGEEEDAGVKLPDIASRTHWLRLKDIILIISIDLSLFKFIINYRLIISQGD